MDRIRHLILNEPTLYLFGALVSIALFAFGFSIDQATTVLFWWYVLCAATIGTYMVLISFFILIISLIEEDTPYGQYLWEQEMEQDYPETARLIAHEYDANHTTWKNDTVRLLVITTIFASLPLSAFLLHQSFVGAVDWWELAGAIVVFIYGITMYHRYNQ